MQPQTLFLLSGIRRQIQPGQSDAVRTLAAVSDTKTAKGCFSGYRGDAAYVPDAKKQTCERSGNGGNCSGCAGGIGSTGETGTDTLIFRHDASIPGCEKTVPQDLALMFRRCFCRRRTHSNTIARYKEAEKRMVCSSTGRMSPEPGTNRTQKACAHACLPQCTMTLF